MKTTVIIQSYRAQAHIACVTCRWDETCLISSKVVELREGLRSVLSGSWTISIPECTGCEAKDEQPA